jgi:mycothiol synthase
MATPEKLKPQLCMERTGLDDLPDISLPDGYVLRSSQPGDGGHWARIINESFGGLDWDTSNFERGMVQHPAYRPDRILFVCAPDRSPCATASAYRQERFGPDVGYLHFVGVCPGHAGKKIGFSASLAVLRKFREEGVDCAVLDTDDFRLPAIKTYLRLGFRPLIVHENQPGRWDRVYSQLDIPPPERYEYRNATE